MHEQERQLGAQTIPLCPHSAGQRHAFVGVVLFALLTLLPAAVSPTLAAVMPFPDADVATTQPMGLDPLSSAGLPELPSAQDGSDAQSLKATLDDATRSADADGTSNTQILDGVLGIEKKDTWIDQTRDAELSGDVSAFDLMRAYVNVVHNGGGGRDHPASSPSAASKQGKGFLMSLAEGLDDPRALNIVTKVIQPYVENDMVNFSILGFGRFMMVGDATSGELSLVNLNNGKQMNLRSSADPDDRMSAYPPNAGPSDMDQVPLLPHEGQTLARLALLIISLLANPIALISITCLLGLWFLYRVAKRLN